MPQSQKVSGKRNVNLNKRKVNGAETSPKTEITPSGDAQLQKEINWCIEQLRMGIFTQKATAKQAQETEKIIKVLASTKAPLVKKRQLMHQTFGDYRKKIQENENKWDKETEDAHTAKYIFLIKSQADPVVKSYCKCNEAAEGICLYKLSNHNFKFRKVFTFIAIRKSHHCNNCKCNG